MQEDHQDHLPIFWEKLKVLSVAVASIAIPLAVAFVGNVYSNSSKRAEIGVRYVEIATSVLKADPADNTEAIRSCAIQIISHYSEVPLPPMAQQQLELHRLSALISDAQEKAHEAEMIKRMKN